jgi:hypothetical protein
MLCFFSSKINHGISIYVYDVTRPCSSALVSCMTGCPRGQCMRHISHCCPALVDTVSNQGEEIRDTCDRSGRNRHCVIKTSL